jgi:hypothetical protein
MEVGIDTKTIAGHASRGGWGGAVGDTGIHTSGVSAVLEMGQHAAAAYE